MVELSTLPVRTFTVGFDDAEYDESRHAGVVAKRLGTDHTVEWLTERDALELIPQVPYMYGEPFADSSALPTHLVARIARRHVTVSLSGDGGDEAFGGYTRYPWLEFAAAVSGPGGLWGRAARPLVSRLPGRIGRAAELLGAPTEVYRRFVAVFPTSEVRALSGDISRFVEFDRAWASTSHRPVRQRAMLADLLTYLPEAILVKVDRAAMATSLETRAPLLDHRVLEFALRLPLRLVRGKRVLKSLVYRRVPRALLERPKQGFGVPLSRWLRGELRSLVFDALTNDRMRAVGVQDYPLVKRIVDEHMSGSRDHPARLWALLVLSLWNDGRRERHDASGTLPVGIPKQAPSAPPVALR
jgi:asparagine synthase (glutamine-hydrolysing)